MSRRYLQVGGTLMILLGLARGAGGAALLARGSAADAAIHAGKAAVFAVGLSLALLGVLLVVAGVGVIRRRRIYWLVGAVATVAFVLGGLMNGTVLYGHPGGAGTAINVLGAAAIIACLWAGRGALDDARKD
jgi:hypothetical protein